MQSFFTNLMSELFIQHSSLGTTQSYYNLMEQSPWQRSLGSLQSHLSQLEESLSARMQRFTPFRSLFNDIHKACDRFAAGLVAVADACDQDILSTLTQSQDSLGSSFVGVRAGLLGVAQCWRVLAIRAKNQVLEPIKVFAENYRKVGTETIGKLKQHLALCIANAQEASRTREAYYASCQRLQKHKDGQAKIMMRIENGQPGELQRFNNTTRMLLEKVALSQQKYKEAVNKANEETVRLRVQVQRQIQAVRNNQTARVEFLKKIASSQLRLLELGKQLNLNFKQESSLPAKMEGKGRSDLADALERVELFAKGNIAETYVSHEQLVKSKRHKEFQQENPLLMELFNKVRENEKASLEQFVKGCLEMEPACRLISIQRGPKGEAKMVFPPEWESCREKIFSLQQYLFFFAHLLDRQLRDYQHYYLKLTPPYFRHLLTLLLTLLDRLDLSADGAMGDIVLSTTYKLLKLAQRVVQRRKQRRVVGNMHIMIEGLGACKRLREEKTLKRLLKFLTKKGKKRTETKGVAGFTKSLFSTLTGKKDESSSEEEQFNALVELTHIMGNLSLPSELTLPLLKSLLKNSGETSYQYLKDIVQGRRDREERQKLVQQEDPKFKLEKELKEILQSKTAGLMALRLTAQRGFLDKTALELRLCCKSLSLIHYHIIYRLPIQLGLQWKWICDPAPLKNFQPSMDSIQLQQRQSQVQDVIHLDVNRSLHLHTDDLPHDYLKKFLVLYAREHNHMSYCQGMNYLAGYVLLKARMQPHAYSIFCHAMQRYFVQIFANNFGGMRLKLYLFQRLLGIFHPDIADHFKREMITPECYAVGWIITAFTSTYQYTRESVLVDWLWARFLPWGWKEFYKLAMGLMQLNRDVLLASGYDGCLQVLGEIPRSRTLVCSDREAFMKEWGNDLETMLEVFPISDKLLGKLTEEFEHQ